MSLTVRHVTPGLGVLPRDISVEACSGLVGVALGIAQAQADAGHRAQVLGWNPNAGSRSWSIGTVEAYATPGWNRARVGGYDFRVTAPMIALASRVGPADVMHAYTDPHLLLSPRVNTRVFHLQTPVPERPARSYSYLVSRADAVICCSGFVREQFLERIDFPAERVYEVTNGVDDRRFQGLDDVPVPDEWEIDREIPTVLFAGALVPEKGLLYLLQAASALLHKHRFQIVVAGSAALWLLPGQSPADVPDEYTRRVLAAAEGLPVKWLGAVSAADMPKVYSIADVFVCPSAWDEPFGMVACEAMAAGKPVIASRRGGLSQIVEDGETGLLVPSEDVPALTSALDAVLDNKELAARMGARARERAKLFGWPVIASRLDSIYQELGVPLGSRPVRAPVTGVD